MLNDNVKCDCNNTLKLFVLNFISVIIFSLEIYFSYWGTMCCLTVGRSGILDYSTLILQSLEWYCFHHNFCILYKYSSQFLCFPILYENIWQKLLDMLLQRLLFVIKLTWTNIFANNEECLSYKPLLDPKFCFLRPILFYILALLFYIITPSTGVGRKKWNAESNSLGHGLTPM